MVFSNPIHHPIIPIRSLPKITMLVELLALPPPADPVSLILFPIFTAAAMAGHRYQHGYDGPRPELFDPSVRMNGLGKQCHWIT